MRLTLFALTLALAGCPNKKAPAGDEPKTETAEPAPKKDEGYHAYRDAKKMGADIEASQKKEEDRDDKIQEKAKQ